VQERDQGRAGGGDSESEDDDIQTQLKRYRMECGSAPMTHSLGRGEQQIEISPQWFMTL
jgi:hypothetical protein